MEGVGGACCLVGVGFEEFEAALVSKDKAEDDWD